VSGPSHKKSKREKMKIKFNRKKPGRPGLNDGERKVGKKKQLIRGSGVGVNRSVCPTFGTREELKRKLDFFVEGKKEEGGRGMARSQVKKKMRKRAGSTKKDFFLL